MHMSLRAHPESAREARNQVKAALASAGADTRETAVLLVSELITNALEHAETDIELDVSRTDDHVRVEVVDGHEDHLLEPGTADPQAERGRGLFLVNTLAVQWGVERRGTGKAVWFTLPLE
jgi:anti-sigma regulatory factor (Ser/Thr protein kinase)